jgi:UDP-N-acetylmuramate dehydrogenase
MNLQLQENIYLKTLTTLRVGGRAKYLVAVKNSDDLVEAVGFAKDKNLPILVLGGGSNVLINDGDINAVVINLINETTTVINEDKKSALVKVEAGKNWNDFVGEMVDKNYAGIECLSGIPGKVGAAPIQNIGAYGQEFKDTFVKLTAYDTKKNLFVEFSKKQCRFGYRDSIFKSPENKGRYIIFDVNLLLHKSTKPTLNYKSLLDFLEEKSISNPSLKNVREAILELRGLKLEDPKVIGNAGSFFKNPIVKKETLLNIQKKYPDIPFFETENKEYKLFAGWLLDKAGWKGRRYKDVGISNKNALVLINPEGKATAKQLKELSKNICVDIEEKFDICLEPEVQFIEL